MMKLKCTSHFKEMHEYYSIKYRYSKYIIGDIGFFCPRCFKPIYAKSNTQQLIENQEAFIDMNVSYRIQCPICEHEFEWNDFPLDPNITESIAILNSKGYKTFASCEGHSDKDYPYIWFRYPYQRYVLKYIPIDLPWKLRVQEDIITDFDPYDIKIVIQNSKKFVIECEPGSSLDDRVFALNKWADVLPNCPTPVFYKKYLHLPLNSYIVKN